jgi:dihydroorotate dehydrogenase
MVVGCNIVKGDLTSAEDAPLEYLRLFRPLYQYADYFTINIGYNSTDECYTPVDKDYVNSILTPLFEFRRGQNQYRPILLKISPDITDEQVDIMTDIMLETPLDGIVACGGTIGRHRLEKSTTTIHSIGRTEGSLCGKPLQERAIEVVKRIYDRAKGTYPIIGCGGVTSPDEAKAMLDAGATLVQICSEFIYGGADSLRNIRTGLNERLRKAELTASTTSESETEEKKEEKND